MPSWGRRIAVAALSILAFGGATAYSAKSNMSTAKTKGGATADPAEQTCGQEIAASAEVPQKWGELMAHVAGNMEWHADWVGTGSAEAKREHDALLRVATEYRAMAAAGGRGAAAMRAMKDVPPAPHDRAKMDRAAQARYMRAKIKMQREFAALLIRHAEESEQALAELEPPR